jgi:hypothetical protein
MLPGLDLVVAMNAGNYRRPGIDQRRNTNTVLFQLVLPSLS